MNRFRYLVGMVAFTLSIVSAVHAIAQEQLRDAKSLAEWMPIAVERTLEGEHASMNRLTYLASEDAASKLDIVEPYFEHDEISVRLLAYSTLSVLANFSRNDTEFVHTVRLRTVNALVSASNEEDYKWLLKVVLNIEDQELNTESRHLLRDHFLDRENLTSREMLLIGRVGNEEFITILRPYTLLEPDEHGESIRSARLALARLGSHEDAQWCVDHVGDQRYSARTLYRHFADLSYTRHDVIIEYFVELLDSKGRAPIFAYDHIPGKEEYRPLVGQVAASELRQFFPNFPDIGEIVDEDELPAVRDFMKDWRSKEIIR